MDQFPNSPRFQSFLVWLKGSSVFVRTVAALVLYGGLGIICYGTWQLVKMGSGIIFAVAPATLHSSGGKEERSIAPSEMRDKHLLEPDPFAVLNPSWKNRYSWDDGRKEVAKSALSPSGYPIVVVLTPTAVCTNPLRLKLAMDLQLAGQISKIDKMKDCLILTEGTRAEWISPNAFDDGSVELRLHSVHGLPFGVFGPSPNGGDSPFYSWIGTLNR